MLFSNLKKKCFYRCFQNHYFCFRLGINLNLKKQNILDHGICHLSIVPLRKENNHRSEMVSQLLYGDCFKILKKRKEWLHVLSLSDSYTGWIDRKQGQEIPTDEAQHIAENPKYAYNLIHYINSTNHEMLPIVLGSNVAGTSLLNQDYDGDITEGEKAKENLVHTASLYLNAPYLWGGKTPFGIDCSGFSQMIYRLNGVALPRDAFQQATVGKTLSFIEESEPGDLAFFDDDEGQIIHVGVLLKNNFIMHAHGNVRIDRIDQTGIFNIQKNIHSHRLRLIKKII